MAYKFRTISAHSSPHQLEYESDVHIVSITFPLDGPSVDKLREISMFKSFIHELKVDCIDGNQSVNDIFTSTVPIGCSVQTITVRYEDSTSRSCVDIVNLSGKVESVHVISSSVNDKDVKKCNLLIKEGVCLTVRLSGFVSECSMVDTGNSCILGGDFIEFLPRVSMTNILSSEKRLSEEEAISLIMR